MLKETNPIEQRIERLTDKWKDATDIKEGRIIRLFYKEEEEEMIDAFIWYMLAVDSLVDDIAFILDPLFTDIDEYSSRLLNSLTSIIREWNESEPAPGIDFQPVDWLPDPSLADKKNPAALFVRNFNQLAEVLNLEDGRFVVAILELPYEPVHKKKVVEWLRDALKTGISSKVKYLIRDREENCLFDGLAGSSGKACITLVPELDMKNVMSQIAAMGDPADPSTPYRIAFVNMMTAMAKDKRKTAQKEGEKCITIARENEKMNPHWKIQEVVVQLALANDEIRHKDYEGARKRTDKAVKAATPLPEELGDSMGKPVLAQAYMARASFACYPEKWKVAMPDFEEAARLYQEAKNELMAIEAYRMAGFCANRAGRKEQSLEYLVAGFHIAAQTNRDSLKASSFSALLRQLIDKNYKKYLSHEEVSTIATELYGEDWQEIIKSIWKKAPDVCMYWEEEDAILPGE